MKRPKDDPSERLLNQFLDCKGIAEEARPLLIAKIHGLVQITLSDRFPKWRERGKYDDLKNLTAVQFLKKVHAPSIQNNVVYKAAIRAIDGPLMDAVDSVISQRIGRNRDLGEAADLIFILSHPAPNGRTTKPRARHNSLQLRG